MNNLFAIKNIVLFTLIVFSTVTIDAQVKEYKLNWAYSNSENKVLCEQCSYTKFKDIDVPKFTTTVEIKSIEGTVKITNQKYTPVLNLNYKNEILKYLNEVDIFTQERAVSRKKHLQIIRLLPYKLENDTIKRLLSFQVETIEKGEEISPNYAQKNSRRWATNSVLNSGDWFKIKVTNTGVHKLNASFLSSLGLDLGSIDPKTIKVYGNHSYMLPELNSSSRNDDLVENAILIDGENDGKFDNSDALYFYAEAPDKWNYNETTSKMEFIKNIGAYFQESDFINTDKGIVHLDVWYDNMAVTDERKITIFDFDFCGNGPQVLDIGYFCKQLFHIETDKKAYELKKGHFLEGYQSIKSLTGKELKLIPKAGLAVFVFYLGVQAKRFDWSNIFLSENYLKMFYIGRLKSWIEYNNIEKAIIV